MPDFLDEFASSIGCQKETLRDRILKGKPNPLQDAFRKHFSPLWRPLANTDE
jgi:hypothetical protein